jgi:hypothetical protein
MPPPAACQHSPNHSAITLAPLSIVATPAFSYQSLSIEAGPDVRKNGLKARKSRQERAGRHAYHC